jgi:iron complex outermembrane receptor protein
VGEQEVSVYRVPGSTVFDAAIRYQVDNWRFALNVKNLADKTYLGSCSYACFYGDERNFTLSARYSW